MEILSLGNLAFRVAVKPAGETVIDGKLGTGNNR